MYFNVEYKGFPSGSDDKESACNVGDLDLIPGLGRSPGENSDLSSVIKALVNGSKYFFPWINQLSPMIWKSITHKNFTCAYYSICLFLIVFSVEKGAWLHWLVTESPE